MMRQAGRRAVVGLASVLALPAAAAEPELSLSSPDGRLQLAFHLGAGDKPRYSVRLDERTVLEDSRLGLVRNDADFTQALELVSVSGTEEVRDEYELLTSKRRLNRYIANRSVAVLQLPEGQRMEIQFQVSNDGVAFRYLFPENDTALHDIRSEASSFRFPAGTRAWLQPMAVAKSGWSSTNPSYEEIYLRDVEVGTPSPTGAGWVYPALFRSGDIWLLVSETGLTRSYCGTRLKSTWRSPEYTVAFPDPLEHFQGGPVAPHGTLPWLTPWRIIVIGDLETIVESTLGTDLAMQPSPSAPRPDGGPGKASWSWPLLGDDDTVFGMQTQFIDYAAEMGWEYTLVDSMWDQQIGYDGLRELVEYARGKDVRILVWYNSAGDWNETFQTPRDRMLTREGRLAEFERLKDIGVAGLKVDFFGGDGQSVMHYYQDILEDAARFGFVINFHGSTLPRGWQRTYPNLMTMEAVRGLEFVTFEQKNAEDEPTHAAMLPFTRNVFDPMDFTPVVLDHINGIERRTTSAFELALSVLFTSGIQHYAEIPEGMARAPGYVKEFLKDMPSIWDEVEFVDAFPGRYVVLARRGGNHWYVAGINAETAPRQVVIDLQAFDATGGTVITDGDGGNLSFRQVPLQTGRRNRATITMQPRGGFVAVVESR